MAVGVGGLKGFDPHLDDCNDGALAALVNRPLGDLVLSFLCH